MCGEAPQQRPQRELALHASERRAETEVDAVAEREMAALGAVDVERVGFVNWLASRLAAASEMITCAPAGIVTPPRSVGATAYRNVECGTGAS